MAAAKSFVVSAGTAALKDSWMKDFKNVLQTIKDAAPAAGQAEVVRTPESCLSEVGVGVASSGGAYL
jgi:hypothetical protein